MTDNHYCFRDPPVFCVIADFKKDVKSCDHVSACVWVLVVLMWFFGSGQLDSLLWF